MSCPVRAGAGTVLAGLALAALACASAQPGVRPPLPAVEDELAEADRLYAERRLGEARDVLARVAAREDVAPEARLRALVDQGVVELEAGEAPAAERTLQSALRLDREGRPGAAAGDRYYPAKALFYLGEVARSRFESLAVDPGTGDEAVLTARLEEKSARLLAAQDRYLDAVRGGDPRWGVAAGTRIGELYEEMHAEMLAAPPPAGLGAEDERAYRAALRGRVRVLLDKATEAYESTLQAARRHDVAGAFVERAEAGLERTRRQSAEAAAASGT